MVSITSTVSLTSLKRHFIHAYLSCMGHDFGIVSAFRYDRLDVYLVDLERDRRWDFVCGFLVRLVLRLVLLLDFNTYRFRFRPPSVVSIISVSSAESGICGTGGGGAGPHGRVGTIGYPGPPAPPTAMPGGITGSHSA